MWKQSCQTAPLPGRLQDGELRGGVRRGEAVHQPRDLPLLVRKVLQDDARDVGFEARTPQCRSVGGRRSSNAWWWQGAAWRCTASASEKLRRQCM